MVDDSVVYVESVTGQVVVTIVCNFYQNMERKYLDIVLPESWSWTQERC